MVLATVLLAAPVAARQQPPVPRPFPQPPQAPAAPSPAAPAPAPGQPPPAAKAGEAPTEASLGLPIYPNAQFLASYDAGRGQRYYLFGAPAAFAEVVAYYKTVLKQKGDLVFEEPPTQMFEVGRYKEETMAFPPGVTVKDYAWGPFKGYLNPKPGAQPERYRTIIQFVPVAATPVRRD